MGQLTASPSSQLDAQAPIIRSDRDNSVASLTTLAANFNAAVGPDGGFPVLERSAGGLRLRGVLALNELEHVLGALPEEVSPLALTLTTRFCFPRVLQPTFRTSPTRPASSALVLRPNRVLPSTQIYRPSLPMSLSRRDATRSTSRRTWTRCSRCSLASSRRAVKLILDPHAGASHHPAALAPRARAAALRQARRAIAHLSERAGPLRRHDQQGAMARLSRRASRAMIRILTPTQAT
jgi:hypothetical protein